MDIPSVSNVILFSCCALFKSQFVKTKQGRKTKEIWHVDFSLASLCFTISWQLCFIFHGLPYVTVQDRTRLCKIAGLSKNISIVHVIISLLVIAVYQESPTLHSVMTALFHSEWRNTSHPCCVVLGIIWDSISGTLQHHNSLSVDQ